MDTINNSIGRHIREARTLEGLKQSEVAEVLRISVASYSRIETGKVSINVETLAKFSDLFNMKFTIAPGSGQMTLKEQVQAYEGGVKILKGLYQDLKTSKAS